ncbi:MAG: MATE family efflux transporter [Ruminococcaceae bacterium]|nr:MATE family efflux transporter [Oscillospiraceae bacterium]
MQAFRKKYIGDRAFYRMALLVALPIMVQNGITQFVALLDNIMLGSVGETQMGGVGVANQLIFVFNLAIFGAVSGAGIFSAQFFGKGDNHGVQNAFRFKLMICAALTVLGIVIFLTLDDTLIRAYLQGEGTAEERTKTLYYAKEYLHIMLVGLVPFVIAQCYSGTLRECGQTIVPMVAGIVSVVINLIFNTILIFGYLGAPKLGSAGAAIATVIARFAEAAVVVIWAHKNPKKCPYVVGLYRTMRMEKRLAMQIGIKTLPLLLNETLWAGGMALLSMAYSLCGLIVVPANTIASTVSNVFNVAFLAMGSAVGIIVGQLLGADKLEEAVDTDRKLIVFSVTICFAIGGVMALLSPYIPNIYTAQPADVRALASDFIMIIGLVMPINSLANACYFTMRSGGKTLVTFLFDSVYICCFTVPLAFFLHSVVGLSILPLFLVCQLTDLGKGIVGLILIKKGVWIQNIVKEDQA